MNATAAELANPVADLVVVATYHGVEVPEAPHLGKGMIESMEAGRYAGTEGICHGSTAGKPPKTRFIRAKIETIILTATSAIGYAAQHCTLLWRFGIGP